MAFIKIPTISSITEGYKQVKSTIDNTVADWLGQTPMGQYYQQQELDRIQRQRQQQYAGDITTATSKLGAISSGYPTTEAERISLLNMVRPDIAAINQVPALREQYLAGRDGGGPPTMRDVPPQQLAQEIPGVDPFTFDYDTQVRKAYDSLAKFYEKLIGFAKGDLDLAKRMLEYTYQQGMRETTSEFAERTAEVIREETIEVPKLITALPRRGVLASGFGGEQKRVQEEGYQARKDVLSRVKADTESRLSKEREFTLEERETGYEKRGFDLERERRKESQEMARTERGVASDVYTAQLQKQSQEEARRTTNIQTRYTGGIIGDAGGGDTSDKWQGKDAQGREYGGWYWKPELNKAQRYWGGDTWTDQ